MAVSLGAYAFACGEYHDPPPILHAPIQVRRFTTFGVHGVGEVQGGKRSRPIPVTCTYLASTEAALQSALGTDDERKNTRTPATLAVGAHTFSNCIFQGLASSPAFYDASRSRWVAFVTLQFESLLA